MRKRNLIFNLKWCEIAEETWNRLSQYSFSVLSNDDELFETTLGGCSDVLPFQIRLWIS